MKKEILPRLLAIGLLMLCVRTLFAAAVNVSSTVNVSSLQDNAELKLTGPTTLNIDVDKTIKSIRGDYDLTIQGSKTLTLYNELAACIWIDNASVVIKSGTIKLSTLNTSIHADQDITIDGGTIDARGGFGVLESVKGSISISNANFNAENTYEGHVIHVGVGNVIINNSTVGLTSNTQTGYGSCIYAETGSIIVNGDITAQSNLSATFYAKKGDININGGKTIIKPTTHTGIVGNGSVYISNATVEATGSFGGITAISGFLQIRNSEVTAKATYNDYGISASKSISIENSTVSAIGKNHAGLYSENGNITIIGGKTDASGKRAIHAKTGNISLSGEVRAYTEDMVGAVLAEQGNLTISDGIINAVSPTVPLSAQGDVTISDGTISSVGLFGGIASSSGSIYIRGGNVTAESRDGNYGDAGIRANQNLIISGGTVTTKSNASYGLHSENGSITLRGGVITAQGKNRAVYANNGTVSVVSPLAVVNPKYGKVKTNKIVNADDTDAAFAIIDIPIIEGTVKLNSKSPVCGDVLMRGIEGEAFKIDDTDIVTEWQRSNDGETGWIVVGTAKTYAVKESDVNKYIRVKITANGYEGYLLSSAVKVVKKQSTTAPVEPALTVNSSNQIVVSNAKAAQEYLITTEWVKDFSTLNWNGSKTVSTDGELNMGGTNSKVNYVYTRMKETTSTYSGTSILMAEQYLGSAATMQRVKLTLSQYQVSRWVTMTPDGRVYFGRAGNPIRVTASSIPADATDFESNGGILGSQWVIDGDNSLYQGEVYYSRYGDAANFYSDYSCTKALEPNKYYKEAYLKPNLQVYDLWVGVGDLGFGDYFYLNVADSNGEHWLIGAMTNDVVLGKGETQTGIPMIIYPATASLNGVTVVCDKDGAPTATIDTHYNKVTFDATNAKGGTYIFSYKKNDKVVGNTWVTVTTIEADEISVVPGEITLDRGEELTLVAQTFPSNNDSGVTWTSSDTNKATVDADGKVTIAADAQRGSTVTITATANGHEAACTITVPKLMPELSFSDEYTDEIVVGETFTGPVLNNPDGLTVTYSSSDESVAIVNSTTGEVTIMGAGYTTITATFAGNADYEASTTSYPLAVLDKKVLLSDNDDNSTTLSTYNNKTVDVTLQDRTLYKDGKWNTLTLPFDVSSLTGTPLEGATIMEMNTAKKNGFDTTSGTLYLAFETATQIEAGKPYLVKWTSGADIVEPVFSDVTISSTTPTAVESATSGLETVRMVGNYAPVTVKADDQSVMFMGDDNSLYYTTEDRTLHNFRAHFEIPSQQSAPTLARSFVIDFDGDEVVTSINGVLISDGGRAEGWYSLDGRRLGRRPSAKGVYIHNGNKVIVK